MRPFLTVAILVLAAAAAGCTSSSRGPLATPAPTTAAKFPVPSFTPELHLPDSTGFAEPGIRVAQDGTIYVTAPGSTDRGAPAGADSVWRSDDHGKTFVKLPTPDSNQGGLDSDIAVASDGTLYQSGLWGVSAGGGSCVSVSMSKDKGATWKPFPFACGTAPMGNDRNWIATDEGHVYVVFGYAPLPLEGQASITLVSLARTGEIPTSTTVSYKDDYQWPGTVAVSPKTGSVFTVYNTVKDAIMILRSTDHGATLAPFKVAERHGDTFDSFVEVAVGKDGTVYAAWSEQDVPDGRPSHHTDVVYAYSVDDGQHWSTPRIINAAPGVDIFPAIDAGDAGHLVVAWYGTPATGTNASSATGASWYVALAESYAANTATPTFVETRASEKPVIKGPICTSGIACERGTRDLLDYFGVSLDKDGRSHLAWATKGDARSPQVAFARQLPPGS